MFIRGCLYEKVSLLDLNKWKDWYNHYLGIKVTSIPNNSNYQTHVQNIANMRDYN
jgi:hypothetical protein